MLIFKDKVFKKPLKILQAFNETELYEAFEEIEALKSRYYLAGYIRYEAKEIFLGNEFNSEFPLLYFEVFDSFEEFKPDMPDYININAFPSISFEEYSNAITKIKSEIACGNTYEVNYTYDWIAESPEDEFELYKFLLLNQKTPYNAFIKNKYETILSFSPELFFEIEDRHIITKPMKGTIRRGENDIQDKQNIEFLKNDIKNRAENVMIVDLLRNDLGRIAKTGSVKVTKLFEIETHKTLHQMTSSIEADLAENIKIVDIFKAIFPCGSITGAPKISTIKIIDEVEKGSRDIYCGAIGLITPQKTIFSVPIRILQKKFNEKHYRYRVGGAVVWDSDTQDEWDESFTKAGILNNGLKLIETIKVQNKALFLGKEHLQRMKKSAEVLGFKFNDELFKLKPEKDGMLRIILSKDGSYELEYKNLERTPVYNVKFSDITLNSNNKMLQHKTTFRPWYEQSAQKIRNGEIYDEIFFNEKGELTEGSRTNILLEIDGKFYTPPLSCGLLNGILRQNLIDCGVCSEKVLYKEDVLKAENIYCINSVRGIKRVYL